MPPDANEEIHRYQHDFPKNVKEEEIQRHEHAQHACLQKQQAGVVGLLVLLDLRVGANHHDDRQQRSQQHQQNADPINAEKVRHPKGRNPASIFHQLQLVRVALKVAQHHQGQHERQHCRDRGGDFRGALVTTREEQGDDHGAQEWQIGNKRQNVGRSRRVLENVLRVRENVLHERTPLSLMPAAVPNLTHVKIR